MAHRGERRAADQMFNSAEPSSSTRGSRRGPKPPSSEEAEGRTLVLCRMKTTTEKTNTVPAFNLDDGSADQTHFCPHLSQ
ncbi:hypothetical protein EYF80_048566 [Liparis tanakae]|uniref:Uncharacterized protein n=1 Tax=Liparis tanakae TaxID=230148 RepID=A0A4Z2FJ91_9TELE|nr:hypothetical protein EYF80_048566 [Liparis tanakae]